jgi:uncharacterized membrane protein YqjE
MARYDRHPPPVPTRDALARLIDGVQTLFREHLALAKIELKDDVRRTGRSVLLSVAGLPPLFVGYVLLMVAIALLLQMVIADWAAFGIVALANLLGGAALTLVFTAKVRAEKLALVKTGEELRRDREWLSSMRNGEGRVGSSPQLPVDSARTTNAARTMTQEPIPGGQGNGRSPTVPSGKTGSTADLSPRTPSPVRGQPVAGATSTPDGEPMTAQQGGVRH